MEVGKDVSRKEREGLPGGRDRASFSPARPLLDLQFFSEEKSEPATPRKRQKSREEGQVVRSQDLVASVILLLGLLMLLMFGLFTGELVVGLFQDLIAYLPSKEIQGDRWLVLPLARSARVFLLSWLPLGLCCTLGALGLMVYQVGFVLTPKPLIPKWNRLNPVEGMKRLISLRSLVELVKGILKALLLLLILYSALRKDLTALIATMRYPFTQGMGAVVDKIWSLSFKMAMMLFVLGLFDYLYQRWEFERSIRMSKQEIKEEYKQMEGDPLVKRRIRQRQRELAQRRMMAEVPKADVVITNPTHLALALQYDREIMEAPLLLAKGEGYIARKIREVAEEHKIPIVQNPPLAQALYREVEVGGEVPEAFYRAVAEVLAFVYRLKGIGPEKS